MLLQADDLLGELQEDEGIPIGIRRAEEEVGRETSNDKEPERSVSYFFIIFSSCLLRRKVPLRSRARFNSLMTVVKEKKVSVRGGREGGT